MKKTFSMIATAIAFVMTFASCDKKEEQELLDPQAGNHVVEATIHAEVSGAFTKALAIEVNYTDFEGNSEKVVVNGKFDGTNTVFEKNIRTKVDGKEKKANVSFKTTLGDVETYKAEKAPWALKCNVVVKLDGKVIGNDGVDDSETNKDLSIFDPSVAWNNWAIAAHNLVEKAYGVDGSRDFVITVGTKEVLCERE